MSLSFPLSETLHSLFFFKRLTSDLQMERAEERFSLCIEVPCTFLTSPGPSLALWPCHSHLNIQKKHMQIILKNCKPCIVLHCYYSGPGWFSPVIMAQCLLLILCTSKTKTIMLCQQGSCFHRSLLYAPHVAVAASTVLYMSCSAPEASSPSICDTRSSLDAT